MKHLLLTIIGTFIGIILFFVAIIMFFGFIGALSASGADDTPGDGYILSMDLRRPVIDHSAGAPIFGPAQLNVVDIVRKLDAAKADESVKGLFIRGTSFGMTPASAEEIRLGIKNFQESGKFVVAHVQGFESTTFTGLLSISAADEIWQQAATPFSISGIRSEVPFYGGVFDYVDAEPQLVQFAEYKNAANVYMESDFTEAHREATTSLLQSIYDTSLEQIAADRGLDKATVVDIFQTSPHSAETAQSVGIVTNLGQYVEAKEQAKLLAADGKSLDDISVRFKKIDDYSIETNFKAPAIAFIGGQGPVVMGESAQGNNPFSQSLSMGGDTVSSAFEAAIKDKKVKAIVFRVSTPGGSATASDQINFMVERAVEAGKPVIISMGQYAASGGYYVSAHADAIVAMPTTITGSIGVLGGKVALRDTFAKVGYNISDVNIGGDFVSAFSSDEPFTDTQLAAYAGQMEEIYQDFTNLVADGRDIPIERVREIAKGRVWTGAQAQDLGLVDHQGGILKAIEIAKEVAEIDAETEIRLKTFPRPKSTQEIIEELFSASAQVSSDLETLSRIGALPEVQAILESREAVSKGQELEAELPNIE